MIKQHSFLKPEIFQLPGFAVQPYNRNVPYQRSMASVADSGCSPPLFRSPDNRDGLSDHSNLMVQLQPLQSIVGFFDLLKELEFAPCLMATCEQLEQDDRYTCKDGSDKGSEPPLADGIARSGATRQSRGESTARLPRFLRLLAMTTNGVGGLTLNVHHHPHLSAHGIWHRLKIIPVTWSGLFFHNVRGACLPVWHDKGRG